MAETEKNQQSWITDDGWEYQYTDGELTITAEPGSLFVGSGLPKSDPVQIKLSAQAAYDLLEYLDQRRDDLFQALHPEAKQEHPSVWQRGRPTVEAWQRDHPFISAEQEEAQKTPSVRYLELRLSRRDWQYLDTLKAALPGLEEEDEAPESQEAGQGVKVLSLRADSLTVTAIKLLNDLHLEYTFRDVQVPTGDTE